MKSATISFLFLVTVAWVGLPSSARAACQPRDGFVDTPHPEVAPLEELVSRIEEIEIDRPLAAVMASNESSSLEDAIDPDSPLPTVTGTHVLTEGEFWAPGSRRVVCLSDDTTLVEQVLEREATDDSNRFRYVVWNYETEAARPIHYGLGEFVHSTIDGDRTHVKWTYSFALKGDEFPGYLGSFGQWLFRVSFLDRQYAEMMSGTLARQKAKAESTQ